MVYIRVDRQGGGRGVEGTLHHSNGGQAVVERGRRDEAKRRGEDLGGGVVERLARAHEALQCGPRREEPELTDQFNGHS